MPRISTCVCAICWRHGQISRVDLSTRFSRHVGHHADSNNCKRDRCGRVIGAKSIKILSLTTSFVTHIYYSHPLPSFKDPCDIWCIYYQFHKVERSNFRRGRRCDVQNHAVTIVPREAETENEYAHFGVNIPCSPVVLCRAGLESAMRLARLYSVCHSK